MDGRLKIGQLAERAGFTRKAIRFYETAGILPAAARASNGYRIYTDEAVGMLEFVKQASGLGLTLAEIRDVIAIRRGGRPPCAHIHQLLKVKARELDQKLRDLLEMRRMVRRSLAAWAHVRSREAAVCPHIERGPRSRRRGRNQPASKP